MIKPIGVEIAAVEARIARERAALQALGGAATERARRGIASPSILAGVVAAGFIAGRALHPGHGAAERPSAPKKSIAGIAGGILWTVVRLRYGSAYNALQAAMTAVNRSQRRRSPDPFGERSVARTGLSEQSAIHGRPL